MFGGKVISWINGAGECWPYFIAMKDYAKTFYKSQAWKRTQAAYKSKMGGLCERCRAKGLIVPGVIVHHKCYITPENINDPSIALSFDNLELLCILCHNQEHTGAVKRYKVDELGRVTSEGA